MSRCCVDKCSDTSDGKIFFTFPASKTLRRKWLEAAPVKEKVTMDSVICNHHFLDHEYEWVRGKTRLKSKVVPSVFNNCRSKSPPKEPRKLTNEVSTDVPAAIDPTTPQTTKKKKSELNGDKHIEQNGDIVKRREPTPSPDEANKDIEDIITNYQIKQIRPINRELIEKEKQNGDGWSGAAQDAGGVVTIEEDADPVYIEVSVDKGGQGGDCLMVLESVQCEVDPGLFDPPPDYGDRKEEPISLLTSSDDDDVIIQEPRIDIVEVSDETDEDDRPLRKPAAAEPPGRARRKKGGRKRGKSKRPPRASPTVLRLCARCGHAAASEAQLARHRRTHRARPRARRSAPPPAEPPDVVAAAVGRHRPSRQPSPVAGGDVGCQC